MTAEYARDTQAHAFDFPKLYNDDDDDEEDSVSVRNESENKRWPSLSAPELNISKVTTSASVTGEFDVTKKSESGKDYVNVMFHDDDDGEKDHVSVMEDHDDGDDDVDAEDTRSDTSGWESDSYLSDVDDIFLALKALKATVPTDECPVCCKMKETFCRPCCDQSICRKCLGRYIESKLEDGVVNIRCPNPSCDSRIQVEELSTLERRDLVALYHRRLVDFNSNPYRKTCPNCGLITEVEPSRLDDRHSSAFGLPIECIECHFQWCFPCHGPWHEGEKCEKNRASEQLLQEWAKRKRITDDPSAQQCPNCKVYVEREGGCQHMTCGLCESEFCYYCGGWWTNSDHAHQCPDLASTTATDQIHADVERRRGRRLRKKLRNGAIIGGVVVGGVVVVPVVLALAVPVIAIGATLYGGACVYDATKRRIRDKKNRRLNVTRSALNVTMQLSERASY